MSGAVYVIAEAGVNHNGQREMAFELVDAAARAGADAVKFQSFNAQTLATGQAPKAAYQKQSTAKDESQQDMLRKLELPRDWHEPLKRHAQAQGIEFLSTAFDADALAFLDALELPIFKVPSGALTNAPLLWQFARTGKPLVLSTGMATLSETEQALAVIAHGLHATQEPARLAEVWQVWGQAAARQRLQGRVILLHCTSQYPAAMESINLKAMDTLRAAFGLPVGYSDHSQGTHVAVAAVAKGATVIEKHFTLNKSLPGPDHAASLEPGELQSMLCQIRQIEAALGDGVKAPQPAEWDTRLAAREQVVAARPLKVGERISRADLTTARAGGGVDAALLWDQIGRVLERNLDAGEAL